MIRGLLDPKIDFIFKNIFGAEKNNRKLEMSIEEIREAKDELIKISADKKQRELYEMRSKILKDKVSALNEAERKGIEKGRKEAIEKIRLKDVETVLKLLNKKFGNVSIEFNDKIENLNGDKLKLIIENILDIDTLDQLREYL